MSVGNLPRLLATTAIACTLAVLLGLQAVSSVSTSSAPRFAVSLFPQNGLAREQLAFEAFVESMGDENSAQDAARNAAGLALATLRTEPLAPKAYAILALSQSDAAIRRQILEAASRLNRRDNSLQGLALEDHLAARDYTRTIETLDQLLRVNPEFSREFFPLLANALAEEENIPLFADLLDGSSPWHEGFLNYAVGQREILPNLALLRPQITIEDENFDRRLISGLATIGDIKGAQDLLRSVAETPAAGPTRGVIDWRSSYPPFEWRLSDEAGFRAQASNDLQTLEISVRPGQGGIIAARLLETPPVPFGIRVAHRIAPADQLRDVRLQLICADSATPFFDERFSRQGEGFRIENVPGGCDYIVLAINARAWSGRSALSGTIEKIELTQTTR